jgi:hypothetical protein
VFDVPIKPEWLIFPQPWFEAHEKGAASAGGPSIRLRTGRSSLDLDQ